MSNNISFFLIVSLYLPTYAQENFKFPIYPGCEILKTNEELSQCFSDKLWEDLRKTKKFEKLENQVNSDLTLYFTIMKDWKISMFSYASGSDPTISKEYLERIETILNDYATKGLYIRPAINDRKYENYRYILEVKPSLK